MLHLSLARCRCRRHHGHPKFLILILAPMASHHCLASRLFNQSLASFFPPLLLLFLCLLLIGFSCLIYTIVCRIPISLFLPRVICPVKLAIPDGLVLLDTNCIHTHTPNRLDRDDQETRMDSERDCGIWLWAYRIFLFSLLLDHGCSIPEESASAGLD